MPHTPSQHPIPAAESTPESATIVPPSSVAPPAAEPDPTLLPNPSGSGSGGAPPASVHSGTFFPPRTLPDVPGYAVSRQVARGGMGVVYAAHDPAFDRQVAIKVMHPDQDAARFVVESKVTAQLPHPGVPPVYALGRLLDGRPFLAMKLIHGGTLADAIREAGRADLPRLIGAFEQICQTVGFAHARGILHRDLKPANVMIGAFGEVLVMDWGLAREMRAADGGIRNPVLGSPIVLGEVLATHAGQVTGTPAFMAPEQARGEPLDARADVFALGGILAAVLTGKAPFAGTTVMETVQQAALGEMAECFERLDRCDADGELVAVAKRCLAAQPGDRYADGAAVAAAVSEYRTGVERRLRTAERERAAAEAKAAEEVNTRREAEARAQAERAKAVEQRKRRHTQLVLAAAVALLVCGAVGFAWWRDNQAGERELADERSRSRQQQIESEGRANAARLAGERDAEARNKATQARQGVNASLELAAELRKQFRFSAAAAALAQGQKLAAGGAPELLPGVEQAQRDLAFVVELDDIRYRKWVWVSNAKGENGFIQGTAATEYRKAFAAHDLDPTALDPPAAAKRITASAVRADLVAALDDWTLHEGDDPRRNRVLEAARRADPGPWTDRLRDPAVRNNPAALAKLAADTDPAAQSPAAVSALATLMTRAGLDPTAVLAAARVRHPADFELSFTLGQLRGGQDRGAAVAPYEAALAVRPDNAAAWNNLGWALQAKGDSGGATAAFRRSLEIDPGQAHVLSNLANLTSEGGQSDEAVEMYRRAIEADPRFANAYLGLGNTYLRKGNPGEAVKLLRKAVEVDPRHPQAFNSLGAALSLLGDQDGAVAAFKTSAALDPGYSLPWNGLAQVLAAKGDKDGALAAYEQAVRIEPNQTQYLAKLASALMDKGDVERATEVLRKAALLEPQNPLIHYNLGLALQVRGDGKGAAVAYREAIKLKPDFFAAYNNLGYLLNDLGDFDAAIAASRAAIRCDPKHPLPHKNLGVSMTRKGDLDGAIAAFREAVRLDPADAKVKDVLDRTIKAKEAAAKKSVQAD